MSPERAKQYVDDIRASAGDPEGAHSIEDDSREHFLQACADGFYTDVMEARQVAKILQQTDDISFPRWCA